MKKNILVGQSGGPTAVINASLYGIIKEAAAHSEQIGSVYGMINGIEGFLSGHIMDLSKELSDEDLELLRLTPAAYLGSCRYKLPEISEDKAIYEKIFAILEELEIMAFFYIGGNDSMDTIKKLSDYAALCGSKILFVGVPKTIDNDIYGTDMTFGFYSAVNIASDAIDCIHTTASSHQRVFIVEVMGHKVGWLTLYAGIASGADVILIPEIPYDIEKVCEAINRRKERGSGFTILAVAEGAIAKEDAALPKKELKKRQEEIAKKYPSVSYKIAEEIEAKTGMEIRVTVPGHMQRGGSPCPYDRVLSTRLGSEAAQLILDKQYGYMVGMVNGKVKKIPLGECAGKLKTVDPNAQEVLQAKRMGISFGD